MIVCFKLDLKKLGFDKESGIYDFWDEKFWAYTVVILL